MGHLLKNSLFILFAAAVLCVSSAQAQLVDYGQLEISAGGKLLITAQTTLNGVLEPNTVWKLEVADSLDGPRQTVTTGITDLSSAAVSVELLGNFYNLDPSFELSGANRGNPEFVSPWRIIMAGAGEYAFMNGYQSAPTNGQWKAYPAQTNDGPRDDPHPTGLIRSGVFALTGDAISFDLLGGSGFDRNLIGLTQADLKAASDGQGFMGVALRDADTGEYLLTKRRNGGENNWQKIEFTAAEIAALMAAGATDVTLDLIDEFSGGWGWMHVDNFQMLGDIPYLENLFYFLSVGETSDLVVMGPMDSDVPEPATWVLMLAGAAVVLLRRRVSR